MESGKLLYLQGDGPTICTDSDRRYGRLPDPIDSELTVARRAVFSATAGNARDTPEWDPAVTIRLRSPAY